MGLLDRMFGGALGAKLLKRRQDAEPAAPAAGQYIPADELDPIRTQPTPVGNGFVERAGRFYRENPKLVYTIGSAVLAIALARLAQNRRRIQP